MKHFLTLALALLAGGVMAAEEGLVGNWPINEGEGTAIKDVGPNQLNGVIQAPADTSWVAGRNGGKALAFSGVNGKAPFVLIDKVTADLTKGMTVMCWIRFDKTFQRDGIYEIASNTRGSFGKGFRLIVHYQRLLLSIGDGDKKMSYANSTFGKNPINGEVWMHVAATHDGDKTLKVYIDGELAGTSTAENSVPMTAGMSALSIGSQFGYSPFPGIVSEVKLYSKALSDAEIMTAAQSE